MSFEETIYTKDFKVVLKIAGWVSLAKYARALPVWDSEMNMKRAPDRNRGRAARRSERPMSNAYALVLWLNKPT
jgi:hypothetical protein